MSDCLKMFIIGVLIGGYVMYGIDKEDKVSIDKIISLCKEHNKDGRNGSVEDLCDAIIN